MSTTNSVRSSQRRRWTAIALAVLLGGLTVASPGLASHVFDDVADDRFYSEPIEWAAETGITTGRAPGIFDPEAAVTRGEVLTFVWRYDQTVASGDADLLGTLACSTGQIAKWDGSSWACANDIDTDTDTLGALGCSSGQIARWGGSSWACANDTQWVRDTDGCDEIQARIDALPAGGGEVLVAAGTFVCEEPIVIARDNVTLRGSGPATLLRLADGANSPLVVIGDITAAPAVTHHHVVLGDLTLDGNRFNQPAGECWGGPCAGPNFRPIRNNGVTIRRSENVLIENVVAMNSESGGLVVERGSRAVTVRGFEASGHGFDGLAAYITTESTFTDLYLHHNTAAGLSFDDEFDRNIVSNVVIADNGSVGIFMRHSRDNLFSGIQIQRSGEHGVFIAHDLGAATAATGNTFNGLTIGDSAEWAMFVANDTNNNTLVTSAQFFGNTSGCVFFPDDEVTLSGTICRP